MALGRAGMSKNPSAAQRKTSSAVTTGTARLGEHTSPRLCVILRCEAHAILPLPLVLPWRSRRCEKKLPPPPVRTNLPQLVQKSIKIPIQKYHAFMDPEDLHQVHSSVPWILQGKGCTEPRPAERFSSGTVAAARHSPLSTGKTLPPRHGTAAGTSDVIEAFVGSVGQGSVMRR
jgi:hypothetical protein